MSTRYRFTSQPWEGGIGLYYYGARWYDPALGRFIQPDTVVPEPGNPQSLNRYSYTLNNPERYTDPTGHWVFEESPNDPVYNIQGVGRVGIPFESPYADESRKAALKTTADILAPMVMEHNEAVIGGTRGEREGLTAASAMLTIVRQGTQLARNDTRVFVEDVSPVMSGHTIDLKGLIRTGQPGGRDPSTYTEFPGSLGFKTQYRDPDMRNPQVHHFWYYVQLSYETTYGIAMSGDILHEIKDGGRSWQDLLLGLQGCELGEALRSQGMKPREVEAWLRTHIVATYR